MAALLLSLSAQHALIEVTQPITGRPNHAVPMMRRIGGARRMHPDVDFDGVDCDQQIAEEQEWRMGRGGGMWMEDQMRHNPLGVRHEELGALQEASWMVEQQMHHGDMPSPHMEAMLPGNCHPGADCVMNFDEDVINMAGPAGFGPGMPFPTNMPY